MTRCLGVLLVLALLLCGCASESIEPSAPIGESVGPDISAPAGLYVPQSAVELDTNGAVRCFRLDDTGYYGCTAVNGELILMRVSDGAGEFTLYEGNNLNAVRTVNLGKNVAPTRAQMQINARGIGYVDNQTNSVVFLNHDFVEIGRVHLSQDITGGAWLTPDWLSVYFCSDKGIHEMDLQTGISRLLLEQTAFHQEITGGFGNREVLRYVRQIAEGEKETLLIDAKTGMTLQNDTLFDDLITQDHQYFLPTTVNCIRRLCFSIGQGDCTFWPKEENATPVMLFDNQAAVTMQETEQQTFLAYYNLKTGKRTSEITLNGITDIWGMQGDGDGGVWLFGKDEMGKQWLYHWNLAKSRIKDRMQYTEPMYSAESPNEAGLVLTAKKAQAVGEKFGINILVWKDAANTAPADQFFTAEHMTQLYDHYLSRLEQALSIFPEGMFTQSVDKMHIALVKEITGEPAWGTLPSVEYVEFWNEERKAPVVAVTLTDDFERNLYHGVYLYMEAQILSKSSALYEWFRINPDDFEYDNNYITNLERTDTTYITGEDRYFIDLFSMSYPREDRAQIFEYACLPGNEEYFQTGTMQTKLKRICKGIREAYGLKNVETTFLWEQYLQ